MQREEDSSWKEALHTDQGHSAAEHAQVADRLIVHEPSLHLSINTCAQKEKQEYDKLYDKKNEA